MPFIIQNAILTLLNTSRFKFIISTILGILPWMIIYSLAGYKLRELINLNNEIGIEDIINYEPNTALDGGVDGLDLIKKVIYKSNDLLKRNGLLAIEIGYNQYRAVSSILSQGGFREISKEYDYNRNVRCIISTKVSFF